MAQNIDTINSKHNYIEHNTFNQCQVGLTSRFNVLKITGNDFNVATVDTSDFVSSIGLLLRHSFFEVNENNRIKSSVYGIALYDNTDRIPSGNWLLENRDVTSLIDSTSNYIYDTKIRNTMSSIIAVDNNLSVQIWCNQFSLYDTAGIHLNTAFPIVLPPYRPNPY